MNFMGKVEEYCPKDKQDWRNWLETNHKEKDSIWLVFYKSKSPDFNLSWSDSVDEALCYGWIDSTKKTIDEYRFKQYFCKRKEKSNWSKVNKDKVTRLIQQGLMSGEGLKSIEIAKENGSWTRLDDIENLVIPNDLKSELSKCQDASAYFEALSKSVKKGMLYWVLSAKRTETRKKRISEIVKNASINKRPKQFR